MFKFIISTLYKRIQISSVQPNKFKLEVYGKHF